MRSRAPDQAPGTLLVASPRKQTALKAQAKRRGTAHVLRLRQQVCPVEGHCEGPLAQQALEHGAIGLADKARADGKLAELPARRQRQGIGGGGEAIGVADEQRAGPQSA
jgi:hypothetical protein